MNIFNKAPEPSLVIEDSKNVAMDRIDSGGGDVHIGDKVIIITQKSAEYKDLLERHEELQDLFATASDETKRLRYSGRLNEISQQIESFKRDVKELAEYFDRSETDTERLQRARQYFENGEISKAREILNPEELSRDQGQLLHAKERLTEKLRRNAEEFIVLAKLTELDYNQENRFRKTIDYYEQALKSDRSAENLFAYALFLQKHNQKAAAIPYCEECLKICRQQCELSQQFLPGLANTLNNLGILQSDNQRFAEAEESYREALDTYRSLAAENPQAFLPDVAMVLNNLGNLQSDNQRFAEAEESYRESLEIYRRLVVDNPQAFLPNVASTLNNLGVLQSNNQQFSEAEVSYAEALAIRRKLATDNPQAFLPDVAMTLNNLGVLQNNNQQLSEAEESHREALVIRRKLAVDNPQAFLPGVAMALNNLGVLQSDNQQFAEAEESYREALDTYRSFVAENPQVFLSDVAMTSINLGVFYQDSVRNKELSLQCIDEAIAALKNFAGLPFVQQYLSKINLILLDWGIDPDEYMKDRWRDEATETSPAELPDLA